jgi:hypothetical protein
MRKERPSSPTRGWAFFSLTKARRDGRIPSLNITSVLEEVSAGKDTLSENMGIWCAAVRLPDVRGPRLADMVSAGLARGQET